MYVKIYKAKKSATQSCLPQDHWVIEYFQDKNAVGHTDNMRWNTSYDTIKQIKQISFQDRHSAITFAESMQMQIVSLEIEETKNTNRRKKNYLDNY